MVFVRPAYSLRCLQDFILLDADNNDDFDNEQSRSLPSFLSFAQQHNVRRFMAILIIIKYIYICVRNIVSGSRAIMN